MYSIWFQHPLFNDLMEVKVDDLAQARATWESLGKQFYLLSTKP